MKAHGENHPSAKLTEREVLEIRALYSTGLYTYMWLANEYGVDGNAVGQILRGLTWVHLTGGRPVEAPSRPLADVCSRGHEWTPENTKINYRKDRPGQPQRRCRKCKNAARSTRDKIKRSKP